MLKPIIYIGKKSGLCNRLEALVAAYAIRMFHGHTIMLDWPELEYLDLPSVSFGNPSLHRRLYKYLKLRDAIDISLLKPYKTIDIRTFLQFPDDIIQSQLETYAPKIKPSSILAEALTQQLGTFTVKPVVGVHFRRGDFKAGDDHTYTAVEDRHTRV